MLRRRLTTRFVFQMALAGILLLILAFSILYWMFQELERIELKRSFAPIGISKLIEESTINEQGQIMNEHLLERLEQDGGWLQRLDEHGQVIQSFFTPEDVPTQYHPAELIEYWQAKRGFPYQLGLWIQPKDEQLFIMLYGRKQPFSQDVQAFMEAATIVHRDITFPPNIEQLLTNKGAWVQIVNAQGTEVADWHKPAEADIPYTLSELALRSTYPERYGTLLHSYYDDDSGLTWIVQEPFQHDVSSSSLLPGIEAELQVVFIAIALFVAATFLIMLLLAFGYANMFIRPIFDIVRWIQDLSKEQHAQIPHVSEHTSLLNNTPSSTSKGRSKGKRKKHLFHEVRESIQTLDAALQANKQSAQQTQVYREEWIAGVTHDMRTPLSSIQGYAHMLAAEQYSWSEQEVRTFAATVLEKSQYMDQLLEDLSLTYRLRSGSLPISLSLQNIPLLLRSIVERVVAHPAYSQYNIIFHEPKEQFQRSIHPPWFERIVSNLIANAVLHNPKHTTIQLTLHCQEGQAWMLEIKDNGMGMDAATMEQLFERYYRGTNTDVNIEGSGLGMAITKELIQAMGGRIEVSSEPSKGSFMRLVWDCAHD